MTTTPTPATKKPDERQTRSIRGTQILYFAERLRAVDSGHIYELLLSKEQKDALARAGEYIQTELIREELQVQTSLFALLLQDLPSVRKILEVEKVALEIAKSEVSTRLREAAALVKERITEANLAAQCLLDLRVSGLERAVADLKAIVEELDHYKKLIMLRDSTLRALVQLNTSEYFASREAAREEGRDG